MCDLRQCIDNKMEKTTFRAGHIDIDTDESNDDGIRHMSLQEIADHGTYICL
jgi:hypothetical protein